MSIIEIKSTPNLPIYTEIFDKLLKSNSFCVNTSDLVNNKFFVGHKKSAFKSSNLEFIHKNQEVNASIIYEDPLLPFSIIKINNDTLISSTSCLEMNNSIIKLNKHVTIVQSSDGSLTELSGRIFSIVNNYSDRYANLIGIKLKTNSALSIMYGAPILDENKHVIGMSIAYDSSKSELFALDINHVKIIINKLTKNIDSIFTGDLGVSLQKIKSSEAAKDFNYDVNYGNSNYVIAVSAVVPLLNGDGLPYYGDIILKINSANVEDDFVEIDNIINEPTTSPAEISIMRNGELKNVPINVENSQNYNIDRYFLLNQKYIFHEITGKVRYYLMNNIEGIILNYKKYNTKSLKKAKISNIIVEKINTQPINSLENFELFLINNCNVTNFIISGYNLQTKNSLYTIIKLNITNSFITEQIFDYKVGKWNNQKNMNFTKICELENELKQNSNKSSTENKTESELNSHNSLNLKDTNDEDESCLNITGSIKNISDISHNNNLINATNNTNTTTEKNNSHVTDENDSNNSQSKTFDDDNNTSILNNTLDKNNTSILNNTLNVNNLTVPNTTIDQNSNNNSNIIIEPNITSCINITFNPNCTNSTLDKNNTNDTNFQLGQNSTTNILINSTNEKNSSNNSLVDYNTTANETSLDENKVNDDEKMATTNSNASLINENKTNIFNNKSNDSNYKSPSTNKVNSTFSDEVDHLFIDEKTRIEEILLNRLYENY